MTVPRQLVADVLERADGYLSAEEIHSIIREDYPAIGLATVYRTLVLMDEMGLVCRYNFGEGCTRYISANDKTEGHHYQFICEKCYKVINCSDLSDEELDLYTRLEKTLSSKYGFTINKHIVQFHGLCPDCSKETS